MDEAGHDGLKVAGGKNTGYVLQGNRQAFTGLDRSKRGLGAGRHLRPEGDGFAEEIVANVQDQRLVKLYVLYDAGRAPQKYGWSRRGCRAHPDFVIRPVPMVVNRI